MDTYMPYAVKTQGGIFRIQGSDLIRESFHVARKSTYSIHGELGPVIPSVVWGLADRPPEC